MNLQGSLPDELDEERKRGFKSLLQSLSQINDIDPLFLEEHLKAASREIINQYDNSVFLKIDEVKKIWSY